MKSPIDRLADEVLAEVSRRRPRPGFPGEPSELVELTAREIDELQADRNRNAAFAVATSGPVTFCGLLIREVAAAGPTRVMSRAELRKAP